MLVSTNADGTVSDGSDHNPAVSGDGRFVLFQSVDNTSQVYLADLLTGTTRIVSTNASGALANAGAFGATLSADGNTVVFESAATNLLGTGDAAPDQTQSQQVYAKNLATGQVTLLSEGGYTPGDATSQDPTVSADGTVAGFASSADNLAPGVLGGDTPSPTSRGYVTAVATAPALAITAPGAALATTSAVLTGTIDHAHATTPITLTDAGDPGFLPVTATVTAGTDPYVDTWTATVIFTQAGPQTVTATAGGTSVQASVTLLNAPSLTINPVNGTGGIAATGQPGHATIVTGSNPAAIGGTVALFLRTEDGHLLTLGSATTGADGRWSISVPDTALGSQSFVSDALVAEAVDASGNKTRAALAIAVTIPARTVLYAYRFTYTDGSFYTGTVADDGTFGYTPGQTITTSAGRYVIGAAGGTTTQAVGSVTAASYYDVSTAATYTPTTAAGGTTDGTGGLGNETDSITGPAGPQSFGGGVTEARVSANTAYDFIYVYNDGSSYSGTVVGGAGSGYKAGQTLKDSTGFYQITSSAGATTAAIGTVSTSLCYDAISAATYVPVLYGQGKASGLQGLGSEEDTLSTPSGGTTFGLGGVAKAALKLVLTYSFEFFYPDGSAYFGYAADDGTYKYSNGEVIKTPHGKYIITSVSTTSVSVGGNALTPGDVTVSLYYDSSSKQNYIPIDYAQGILTATEGLGTEGDLITGVSGTLLFGYGGLYEAKQYPDRLFAFTFTYKDGSSYYGNVVDDGSYDYYDKETVTTAYGHYHIGYSSPLISGEGGLVSGEVYTQNYYDITSGGPYETFHQSVDTPSGVAGLGSENDSVLDSAGVAHSFGAGGLHEAKLAPYTLLDFTFYYKDGSFYTGQLSSDGINGPQAGQSISTPAGYFDVYARDGATGALPGTVSLYNYYDITDGNYYTPHSYSGDDIFGTYGLSSAIGYLDGPLLFGDGGAYEAKHAPDTSWQFQFIYPDGSFYYGHVVDNGQLGFHPGFIENTPFGYYFLNGSTSKTSLPLGSVTLDYYYDVTTQKLYTPVDEGAQGIDGTSGLGSEYADTRDDGDDEEFGYGGQYEAKQSEVRHFTFTFRYNDGSFYYGDFASYVHLYLPGTIIQATGGYYVITAFDDEHSSLPSGTVHVSSYFDIGTGRFYTPVRYAEGKASGTDDIGSELDYISAGGGGLRSFGGPTHIEANTTNFGFIARLTTATEFAFDGPIQGAAVGYLDPTALPGTLSIDPAQPTATTNADGSYQLGAGSGPLVLTGGTDTATGLPFKGVLESAGNGSVLSPVTTLLEATAIALGDTSLSGIAAAEALLSTALGLPAGIDLTTYLPGDILRDPATSPNDIPTAEAIYRAGAKLLDAETLIDAAGGNSLAAIDTVAAALADGSLTDLTDITALIEDGGLAPPAETAIKIIVAATNTALDHQLADVNTPAAILAFISGASIALQGGAATALAAADADDAAIATNYVLTLPFTLQADDQQAFDGNVACYRAGTGILTDRGEVAVEDLRVGDRVKTHFSGMAPVTWVGHRRIDCLRHPDPARVWPVRVRAHSFGPGRPHHDLWLSPDHSVFVNGDLIPIKYLTNDATIRQVSMDSVMYYHMELARHDVVLAQGLPAESYLETGHRSDFANGGKTVALFPSLTPLIWDGMRCARMVITGPELQTVRASLDLHARELLAAWIVVPSCEIGACGAGPISPSDVATLGGGCEQGQATARWRC